MQMQSGAGHGDGKEMQMQMQSAAEGHGDGPEMQQRAAVMAGGKPSCAATGNVQGRAGGSEGGQQVQWAEAVMRGDKAPPPRPSRPELIRRVAEASDEEKRVLLEGNTPEYLTLEGQPLPCLYSTQGGSYVKDKLGRERQLKVCSNCDTGYFHSNFHGYMWDRKIGVVRICKTCLANLTCTDCGENCHPGEFSFTQRLKVQP